MSQIQDGAGILLKIILILAPCIVNFKLLPQASHTAYEKLAGDLKAELPLKRTWTVAPQEQ